MIVESLAVWIQVEFPEMEVLWMLAKAWNCGIHLYSALRYKEAERWCSLGMRFLTHLSELKSTYEEQVCNQCTLLQSYKVFFHYSADIQRVH